VLSAALRALDPRACRQPARRRSAADALSVTRDARAAPAPAQVLGFGAVACALLHHVPGAQARRPAASLLRSVRAAALYL
jgi:hypothetical protein